MRCGALFLGVPAEEAAAAALETPSTSAKSDSVNPLPLQRAELFEDCGVWGGFPGPLRD